MAIAMEYLTAAIVGLSIGVIYAHVAYPTGRSLPTISISLITIVIVWAVVWGPASRPALGVIIGVTSIIGLALTGAQRWKDNPLFADTSYGIRALTWMWRVPPLREAEQAKRSNAEQ